MSKAAKKPPNKAGPQQGAEEREAELKAKIEENRSRCLALERFLVVRAEQTQRAQLEQDQLKRKIVELNHKFAEEEKQTEVTSGDMYRQYKAMQHELIHRIDLLQTTINNLRDELEESRLQLERTKAEKDAIIAEKNKKINEQKQKMEDMAIEFGEMLKETLEQMSKRIDTGTGKGGGGA
eukprot:TRINITY_DN8054_c0_g1_i2.p1 TRINITY_DN8054_c0_g1~~TRINITY_DN8054_c0_g1_i2.p1  ORF type:complete len:180 (-),score=85.28 TRINITY_DN8054_c0_g1_i2:99-638(-)